MKLRPTIITYKRRGHPTLAWELERTCIGSGSYGAVYAADPHPRPPAALPGRRSMAIKVQKVLKAWHRESLVNDIRIEVEAMRKCAHARVVVLLHAFSGSANRPTHFYIVMPLAQGTMNDVAARFPNGTIPHPILRTIMHELYTGLEYCHSQRVCHRDVKPANVLVTDMANCRGLRIADFGAAQEFPNNAGPMIFRDFGRGTLLYAAPESFCGYRPILHGGGYDGPKVDVFAAAITMATLLHHEPRSRPGDNTLLASDVTDHQAQNLAIDAQNRILARNHVQFINAWRGTFRQQPHISRDMRLFLNAVSVPNPANRLNATQALAHIYLP